MATLIPSAGSAYTYSYAVLGETLAWVVGWSLILEYSVGTSAVAVGWSGYADRLPYNAYGVHLPHALSTVGLLAGGWSDQPAGRLHRLSGRRPADRRDAGERDAERRPGGDQDRRPVRVRRLRPAALQYRQLPALHALWLRGPRRRRRQARGDGRGRDHLLRLLWLRRPVDGFGGNQGSRPEPADRHHRLDGDLHRPLYRRGGRRGGLDLLRQLRRQPRASGPDPAPARPRRTSPRPSALAAVDRLCSDGDTFGLSHSSRIRIFVMARDGLLPQGLAKVSRSTRHAVQV